MTLWKWIMGIWDQWKADKDARRKRYEDNYKKGKMESVLRLDRKWYTDKSTIGPITFDNEPVCDILEDTIRDPNKNGRLEASEKIYGETAIPSGRYEIVITYSEKFQKKVPMLLDVPNFSRIYIHSGNDDDDTLGCLLTGTYNPDTPDWVSGSRTAFNKLMPMIEKALTMRRVFIEISGGPIA